MIKITCHTTALQLVNGIHFAPLNSSAFFKVNESTAVCTSDWVCCSPVELMSDSNVFQGSLQQQHHQRSIQLPLTLQSLQDRSRDYITTSATVGRLCLHSKSELEMLTSNNVTDRHTDDRVRSLSVCVFTWTSCGRNISSSPSGICSKYRTAVLRTIWSWKLNKVYGMGWRNDEGKIYKTY